MLAAGDDPAQRKQDAKLIRAMSDANTFEFVACKWWAAGSTNKSPRHAAHVQRRLEADIFPALGARPAAEIEAPELVKMAKAVEACGAMDIAKRSLVTCSQVFRFAIAHGLGGAKRNPATARQCNIRSVISATTETESVLKFLIFRFLKSGSCQAPAMLPEAPRRRTRKPGPTQKELFYHGPAKPTP